jgi:hypothetical protein
MLDGFPRTVGQLEKFLKQYPKIHKVINFTMREDILI